MDPAILCVLFCITFSVPAHAAYRCVSDESCFYNGKCINDSCVCNQGWRNENCTSLNLLPAPVVGAYGYLPNVTSWGGNVVRDSEGLYHLFVTEMINHCGLCHWQTNSEVVHAVSKTPLGPYTFSDVAIRDWTHNPLIVVDNSKQEPLYLIFHIGAGSPKGAVKCPANESTEEPMDGVGSLLHVSKSLNGPWQPINATGYPYGCNNPAAHVFPNGSILVICTWGAHFAESYEGPYVKQAFEFSGNAGMGTWEDPFIWYENGIWKMLSHVWIGTGDLYAKRVAGFAYSKDGYHWVRTWQEPFDVHVELENDTTISLTTRERPKLLFDENGRMVALFNGVASVVGGQKSKCGADWTYTLAQPIGE